MKKTERPAEKLLAARIARLKEQLDANKALVRHWRSRAQKVSAARGWTLLQVARYIGIDHTQFSHQLAGRRIASMKQIERVEDALSRLERTEIKGKRSVDKPVG